MKKYSMMMKIMWFLYCDLSDKEILPGAHVAPASVEMINIETNNAVLDDVLDMVEDAVDDVVDNKVEDVVEVDSIINRESILERIQTKVSSLNYKGICLFYSNLLHGRTSKKDILVDIGYIHQLVS